MSARSLGVACLQLYICDIVVHARGSALSVWVMAFGDGHDTNVGALGSIGFGA